MKNIKYHLHLGATVACTKIITELTKGIDQRGIKGDTKDCFLFYSWFSSSMSEESAMFVGAEMIFRVLKKLILQVEH